LTQLLTDDDVFDKLKTSQLAYAEAWSLVHYLLRPNQLRKFQAYLAAVPKLGGAVGRVKHAEANLGPLEALDQDVRRYVRQMLQR
jgi:hypothetical protein